MGIDYRAKTFLSVVFTVGDFINIEERRVVLCAHPEAAGVRFCPVCGLIEGQRVRTERFETPVAAIKHLSPFDEMSADGEKEGWFRNWLSEAEPGYEEIGGMTLHRVEQRSGYIYYLVDKLLETESNRSGGGDDALLVSDILPRIETFQASTRLLGLNHPIRLVCELDVG